MTLQWQRRNDDDKARVWQGNSYSFPQIPPGSKIRVLQMGERGKTFYLFTLVPLWRGWRRGHGWQLKEFAIEAHDFGNTLEFETLESNVEENEVLIEEEKPVNHVVGHLSGSFAFILFDKSTSTLFLAPDQYGKVPMYWEITADDYVPFVDDAELLKGGRASSCCSQTIEDEEKKGSLRGGIVNVGIEGNGGTLSYGIVVMLEMLVGSGTKVVGRDGIVGSDVTLRGMVGVKGGNGVVDRMVNAMERQHAAQAPRNHYGLNDFLRHDSPKFNGKATPDKEIKELPALVEKAKTVELLETNPSRVVRAPKSSLFRKQQQKKPYVRSAQPKPEPML
ncbi:uncharacterized protein HKW66_Vig0148650 [Vigna angularis]|uniref:DUF3700 domain-containing protein n=1 Tax=Phaseolus angularis TaxID=3914 RepID=A0A8T0JXL9_PHAAN|nr:uncharacterized protein HKW66_Vig0148650 [Vigna angularis]